MVMGCAGHVCCRGGAMGAVGGLHLLRKQRDRKADLWSGSMDIGPVT